MDYKDLRSIQETYNAMYSEEVVDEGKYSSGSVTYVKGTAPVRATYGGKTETFPKETYKKKGMVRTAEEVEEVAEEGLAGMIDKATKAGQAGLERMGVKINRAPKPTARPSATTSNTMRQNKTSMEEVDVFDIVKGHLIDEGATESEAIKAMLSMTEEEINAIVEGAPYVVTAADKAGNTPAYQNYLKGMKNKKTGEPLYKAAPHLKGV